MRRRLFALIGILGASMAAAIGLSAPAEAVGTGHVNSVVVDPGPLSVDGMFGSAKVTISVVATDDRGHIGDCSHPSFESSMMGHIEAALVRTAGGATAYARVNLDRYTSGPDGEHWTGTWNAGSNRSGTWTVASLWWCVGMEDYGVDTSTLGAPAPTTTIIGTHMPTATYAYIPAIAAYGVRQWLIASYRDGDGRPLAHYPIIYGADDMCGVFGDGSGSISTDAQGRVTVRLTRDVWQCLYFAFPGRLPWTPATTLFDTYYLTGPQYYRSVTAVVSPAVVRVARAVTVTGTVSPSQRQQIALQKLVGRTWRTVATAGLRASGHVTFTYVPTSLGVTYLRVQGPAAFDLVPTSSRPVTVTAVRR